MAVMQIVKHARSVRGTGQNYIAMAHRLWREHIAEALQLASYQSTDLVFPGSLAAETGLPIHIVPEDCEIVKVQLKAAAAGSSDGTIKITDGTDDLFAAVTLNDTSVKTATLVDAEKARAGGDVLHLVSTIGVTAPSDIVVTVTYKRIVNNTRA